MPTASVTTHTSHGVIHLAKYVRELEAGLIQPGASIETLHESASIAVLDGNWSFGPVIATRAVALAIEKAKQTDIGSVAVSRCNETGRLGGYACLASDAEMIALLTANDHGGGACVVPHGGVEGRTLYQSDRVCSADEGCHPNYWVGGIAGLVFSCSCSLTYAFPSLSIAACSWRCTSRL